MWVMTSLQAWGVSKIRYDVKLSLVSKFFSVCNFDNKYVEHIEKQVSTII
jgi:hypothetical protein